jgi:hypothetical protein
LVLRLMGVSARELEDDQVALGNSSFRLGSWRSATTVSSGSFSRGSDGRGVSAVLSLVTGGGSGRAGIVVREELGLSGARRESLLAITDGALVIRVGGVRAIRLGAGSLVSDGGRSETGIVSG